MGLLSRIRKQPPTGLPPNWKRTLNGCNFFMARRAIAYVFHVANQQAESEGHKLVAKKELAEGWERFKENPCYDTAVQFLMASPDLLPYFDGAFQRSLYPAIRAARGFSFEQNRLPDKATDVKELNELSEQEYAFFPRQFKGEIIYHAAPIRFLGREWALMIPSVHNKVYKWAASVEVGKYEDVDSIANEVIEYCIRSLGATTEERAGYLFWDTPDGNVILQLTNAQDWFDISIFVTSREIRGLDRL